MKILTEAGVPCGPINSVAEAFADPQTEARGMVVETDHPRFGRVRQPGSPVRVGDEPIPYRRGPLRNEDADAILGGLLGYDNARVEGLRAGGAFG